MLLINTTTFSLEFIFNCEDYEYAILSHTWGEEEVILEDMADLAKARTKRGFVKIEQTCRLARERGIKYAWVDTCCIDKTSSADLTEAINSMFQWYKKSKICFVFLFELAPNRSPDFDGKIAQCRWFTRGWTLQELIASSTIEFYDENWGFRGDKISLQQPLSSITNIDIEVLQDSDLLSTIAVARRMSWAATRQTTRLEDRAYSLFGLFDVNLPLIYGEGPKAFIRLQEAIAVNNDLSLFAWTAEEDDDQELRGLLAKSPSEFKDCRGLVSVLDPRFPPADFTTSNQGFHLKARSYTYYMLDLRCMDESKNQEQEEQSIAIFISRTAYGHIRHKPKQRITCNHLGVGAEIAVQIPKYITSAQSRLLVEQLAHKFQLRFKIYNEFECSFENYPKHLYDSYDKAFITNGFPNFTGVLIMKIGVSHISVVMGRTYHEGRYIITFGLDSVPRHPVIASSREVLRPWAAIFEHDQRNEVSNLFNESSSWMVPGSLINIGSYIREKVKMGETIPTILLVDGAWKSTLSSHVKIEVSVETDEAKRSSGMYEMLVQVSDVMFDGTNLGED